MTREVQIFVRDKHFNPLPGASVEFWLNEVSFGKVPADGAEGRGRIKAPDDAVIAVEARYGTEQPQKATLGQDVTLHTFTFNVTGAYSPMVKNIMAALAALVLVVAITLGAFYLGILAGALPLALGVILLIVALALAFYFGSPTLLQAQLIRSTFAIAAGALASQIPGWLSLNVTISEKAAITATGAIAVFVIVFFFVPARDK